MSDLPKGWRDLPFFAEDWPRIADVLAAETRPIFPPAALRFAALERTAPQDVRVVILGQDPYPTAGHANGLSFSVAPDVTPLPRSLNNIFKELAEDIGSTPKNGDLGFWADQGVLLLNTALSVPEGNAGAHAKLGWSSLAQQVVSKTSTRPTAYLLWGRNAQGFRQFIIGEDHLILETAHPSPLSARRGFFGSRPFSKINNWLTKRGEPPINWISP